jgi:hypothetical protein
MKTDTEIKDKIEKLKAVHEGDNLHDSARFDVPWREVAQYGVYILSWVLGEVKDARFCSLHRKAYDCSNGEQGCPECLGDDKPVN